MDDGNPTGGTFLFSTCHRDDEEGITFWSYAVGVGADPWQAWALVAEREALELVEYPCDTGQVYAMSCDAVLADFDSGDLAALWPANEERPWGRLIYDEQGHRVAHWDDTGPMRVHQTLSVFEYRYPRPGSSALEEDGVRSSTTRVSLALEHDGYVLLTDWDETSGEFWTLPDGMQLPQVVAPPDPRGKYHWSYLTCWLFLAPADVELPDRVTVLGARELLERDGIRLDRRTSAREIMLQRWRDFGSRWALAADQELSTMRGVRTFELLLPYDPRPVTDLLPSPDGEVGEILEITETRIGAADLIEHPQLGGYAGDTGYRVQCLAGVGDADGDHDMLWAKLTERMRVADAACALSRLTALAEAAGEPWRRDLEAPEPIADLRTASGYGDLYVLTRDGQLFLVEHSRAGTQSWSLTGIEPERIALLASQLNPQQLPRLTR